MRPFSVFAAVAAAACFATPAHATLWTFNNIFIDGLQETPPVATSGSGTGTATLDDVTGAFTVAGSFSGLIGTTTNAHLHGPAPPGTPAGVIVGIPFDFGVTSGTFGGNAVLNATNIQRVLDGLTYINIHTTFRPGGEIRGQLLNPVPEPATALLLASGACGLFLLRRRSRQ